MTLLFAIAGPIIPIAHATVFSRNGASEGINIAENINGINNSNDPRPVVESLLSSALNYVALIAVVAIVIAGFYLLFSFVNETGRDRAKKIILYTIIGLIVLLFAEFIVEFLRSGTPFT